MLPNCYRTFQQFYSNRLQHHSLVSIITKYDRSQAFAYSSNIINDIMTQKDQTQSHALDAVDLDYQISSSSSSSTSTANQHEIAPKKLLPFDAIPCADNQRSNNVGGRFSVIAHKLRQLLTAQWDNRFHEEIDECHQRYGPIFRKSLANNQGAHFLSYVINSKQKQQRMDVNVDPCGLFIVVVVFFNLASNKQKN